MTILSLAMFTSAVTMRHSTLFLIFMAGKGDTVPLTLAFLLVPSMSLTPETVQGDFAIAIAPLPPLVRMCVYVCLFIPLDGS